MGKKSEERAQRRALKDKSFEAGKAALIAKVNIEKSPRQAIEPTQNQAPRLAPHVVRKIALEAAKVPKVIEDGSRFSSRVTWCTSKTDKNESWSWGEYRQWSQDEWDTVIHPPFKEFEKLTWQEIDKFSSDTGHKMHHGHEVSDLISEAQSRWKALGLEQYDSVFRFRLGGQKCRAWGFIVQAHFHFVWWDREHSIYPTEPS